MEREEHFWRRRKDIYEGMRCYAWWSLTRMWEALTPAAYSSHIIFIPCSTCPANPPPSSSSGGGEGCGVSKQPTPWW